MTKGIKFVGIVMAVMVLIGTMMVPAHADYEKPEVSFEEKFETIMELVLEKDGMKDFVEVTDIQEIDGGHVVTMKTKDHGAESIKENYNIKSDNVEAKIVLVIMNDRSYSVNGFLYVDGEFYDYDWNYGSDIYEDLF